MENNLTVQNLQDVENHPTHSLQGGPRTSWGESCNPSPYSGCCWWLKTFLIFFPSHPGLFSLRQSWQGGYSTWALACERWERPRQSSANSPDQIVPQIPKAGLGLSNLAPKTAPASIPRAGAASLIPRNRELCSRICHSDLQQQQPRQGGKKGFWGGSQHPADATPQKSRAGLAVALHGC